MADGARRHPALRLTAAILFTLAWCAGLVMVATRARGLLMIGGLGIALGAHWILGAWKDWRRPAPNPRGRSARRRH